MAKGFRIAVVETDIRRSVRLLAALDRSIEMFTLDARRRFGSSAAINGTATDICGGGKFRGLAGHFNSGKTAEID